MSSILRENAEFNMLTQRMDDRDLDDGNAWSFAPDAPKEVLAFDATDAISQAEMVEAEARKAAELVAQIEALQRAGAQFFDRVDGAATQPYGEAEAAADHAALVGQLEGVERVLRAEMLEHLPLHPAEPASAAEEAQLAEGKAATDAALRHVASKLTACATKLGGSR